MADVRCKFGNKSQLALLAGGPGGRNTAEGMGKGHMICEHMKNTTFQLESEMAERKVHSKQLSIKGGVTLLGRVQLLREEGEGAPGTADPLLQDGTDMGGGGIHGQGDLCAGGGVHKRRGSCQGGLGGQKGGIQGGGPNQDLGGTDQGVSEWAENAGDGRQKTAVKVHQTQEAL